ncbi:MAG: SEC-C metal-binding domain-containing protein, partial [Terriglobales bacterium]
VRYLYLMQILERPAEPNLLARSQPDPAATGVESSAPAVITGGQGGNGRPRHVTTSVDEIEEAFQRKKKRELEQARMAGAGDRQVQQVVRSGDKVGRNDPCPCGSGKKYKKCHGA